MKEVVIVSMARTPVGKFGGSLSKVSAIELGTIAVKGALERAGIRPDQVTEVTAGIVYKHGLKGNPGRQVQLRAGIPTETPALTVDQQCASGMRAFEIAVHQIQLGKAEIAVAIGMESMSNTPHLLLDSRNGYRLGAEIIEDALLYDGLIDGGFHMGNTAENLAERYNISRREQNEYAALSHKRAVAAKESGKFKKEIVPVEFEMEEGIHIVDEDECPNPKTTVDKLLKLRPAFKEEGTVTAGNSSSLNDGAAALVLMSVEKAKEMNLKPLVKVSSTASAGVDPEIMGIGPVHAVHKALNFANLELKDIEYFEINEAFAAQILAVNKELKIPIDNLNANGSGISIGHPVGCTGIRIIQALVSEMKRRNSKYGCASVCAGGGPSMAVVVENIKKD